MPLFLALLREVGERDPAIAQAALRGLRRYQEAAPPAPRRERPVIARHGGASLRDLGGAGQTVILIPSLINPPWILDLDSGNSLGDALSPVARILLLDWGDAVSRNMLDLGDHVRSLLIPLIEQAGPVVLVGYCLGGTLALGAASQTPSIEGVVTLAAPWHFGGYSDEARDALRGMLSSGLPASQQFGSLPMEILQSAFWALDPDRVVGKFARFGELDLHSDEARRFVALEDWANGGEPLPLPAARELVENLFGRDLSGLDRWMGGLPRCPQLHVIASNDRIVPAESAAPGPRLQSPSGHVGMIVGRDAARSLHQPLRQWLEGLGRGR